MERASQSLNSIGAGKVFGDTDCIAKLNDCRARLTAQVRAPGKPSENDGLAVAWRFIQPSKNALEDLCRLAYLTLRQQSLTTLAIGDKPLLRALRATRVLFAALLSHYGNPIQRPPMATVVHRESETKAANL